MLDVRIRFRHLQCFLTIAQKRSVGRAAEVLSITQPALSKTLKELEDALGVRLFERDKKGMSLTKFGDIFMHHAAASISSLRHGVDSIKLAQAKGAFGVSVGALPNAMTDLLPAAVKAFKATAPTTQVSVVAGDNAQLLGRLRHGELDIVVGRLARLEHMAGLSFDPLYNERIVIAVRAGHPLAGKSPVTPEMIGQFPLILPNRETIIRQEIDRFLIAQGIESPADTIESTAVVFGAEYTERTDTIWFVPYGVVARYLADRRLIELPVGDESLGGPVGLTTRVEDPLSPAAALMLHAIRGAARASHPASDSHLGMDQAEKAIWRGSRPSSKQAAARKRPIKKKSKRRNVRRPQTS